MGLTFALSASAFWEQLRFAGRPAFELVQYQQESMDAAGNVISAAFGEPQWRADVQLEGGRHNRNMESEALIKALIGRNGTFLAYDTRRPYPKLDPLGAAVTGSTLAVKTKGSNNRSLSIEGLPLTGYVLSVGDYIAVRNGSGNRVILQAMEADTANGMGDSGEFEVQPHLPTWLQVGDTVDLIKPNGKFRILSGSYRPGSGAGNMATGPSFTMVSV